MKAPGEIPPPPERARDGPVGTKADAKGIKVVTDIQIRDGKKIKVALWVVPCVKVAQGSR